jgi:hypothetical protein
MKRFAMGLALVFSVVLTAGTSTAHAAKGAKKKGEHEHHGTIVAVEENGGHGHLTIKTHHHHKKTEGVVGGKLEKFHISSSTRFEIAHKMEHVPATVAALHLGEHVFVLAHEHHADLVVIHHPHQHKPKKIK